LFGQTKKYKQHNEVPIDEYTERQIVDLSTIMDSLEEEEQRQTIKECLHLLSSEDFLLTLYYYEEQSLDEISKIIGLTANNVKVKLFRSRKKISGYFKERLEPEIIEHYARENR
jgi:RNA polymerase sigma-70 factor (ECF subfamily)